MAYLWPELLVQTDCVRERRDSSESEPVVWYARWTKRYTTAVVLLAGLGRSLLLRLACQSGISRCMSCFVLLDVSNWDPLRMLYAQHA